MCVPLASEEREPPAFAIFARFCELQAAGGASDPRQLIADHPECAAELAGMLEALGIGERGLDLEREEHRRRRIEVASELEKLQHATRYERGQRIGVGGMGAVYRAHDRKLNRELAMKVIRDQDDASAGSPGILPMDLLRRFLR